MGSWIIFNGALLIAGYLLGSIPSGYALGKWMLGIDIREVGSGSTGATNVLRTLGKWPGLGVLLVDVLKGVSAIVLIRYIYSLDFTAQLATAAGLENTATVIPWMATLAGFSAILGHSKSIWLGFTGGKSVATSLGVLLGLYWPVGLGTFGIFGIVFALSRIVSLSSIIGAISVAGLMFALNQPLAYVLFGIAGGVFVIVRHRSNIQRLLKGTEPKIGEKLETAASDR
ncbi:glycerol-3-phosphate 1-O-acyltransferase PlsY [Microcoleus sp. LEGE 07076]|uniref:glycerol-3-phosphate 1-O-acyltransferase PlsY n=1 Tax=Microcoleus sp. LEGE 07076 TaxID=915322 RepID=UPI00187E91BC|nr:glycerol-3-phosphate 1-O-acyltransferase PlsY [Microcoleus sp. LEGE 07076]MBE9187349.1 glycerol-3-phosphate 1-O-acyltransferase PlsY [Microcoleus sp. LEGE 07076]